MQEQEIQGVAFEEVTIGQVGCHDYVISDRVYESFLNGFGDRNPLHVDRTYARAHGFPAEVMHGSILNGFISHFVGMCLPGREGILHSVAIEFRAPSFAGDRIRLEAKVVQKVDALRVVLMSMTLSNLTQQKLAAKAKVQVGFLQSE